MRKSALILTAFALFAAPLPGMAQQANPFVAACIAQKKFTPSGCACQAKLARATLDRGEQQAALSALRGDKEAFARQMRAFGAAKAKVFVGKMDTLSVRSRAECK